MLFDNEIELFPWSLDEINQRIHLFDPLKYGKTRNYLNGNLSYLSPYISRGVISTKYVFVQLMNRGYQPSHIEKFIQELAWRDYWQQIWKVKGNAINKDLKNEQRPVANRSVSQAIVKGSTGIQAIDQSIKDFYKTGYMHNHLRMYVASLACNIAQSHWKQPARWMYYHLLDADWASNALSWQWVAGANSHKKYYANQENINKFCFTNQKNTFVDIPYEEFPDLRIPEVLLENIDLTLFTPLPKSREMEVNENLSTCIYNFYNLDPLWRKNEAVNRVLLIEPSHFKTFPVSAKSIDFMLSLSRNIENIQIFVGEFDDLIKGYPCKNIYYKEHPLSMHYHGIEDQRDWLGSVEGYYPSFFAFWKKLRKELFAS